MISLKSLCREAHVIAVDKGWYNPVKSFGEMILMGHVELSEAVQEFRKPGMAANEVYYTASEEPGPEKPCGVPIELADAVIRIADLCEYYEIDIEDAIQQKMAYNRTRPRRHGNKTL